jgi:tetratricopeptide (TPR) repeat protein
LTQALAQPPTEADALALLYFRLGTIHQVGEPVDLDQAIDHYSRVLALQPGWVAATNNRGVAYLGRGRIGDLDRSISDLTQAIADSPDYAVAYMNRGAAYLERMEAGDVNRALEDLGRAVDLAPDSSTAFINRGAAYLERGEAGDVQRAVEDFSRAIQLAPDAAGGYLNRGLAYIQQGERERWLEDLGRAMELDGDQAGTLNALCWGYALDQEPDLALPYCQQSLALDPNGFARDSLGVVYSQLGRLDEATQEFEAFLDWLQQEKGSVYWRHGPVREAWLRELKAGRNPIDAEALEQLRLE